MNKFSEHIVIQRFNSVYNLLLDTNKIKGKSDLAEKLDTYNHVINDILKGKRSITIDQLNKLFLIFNIDANYIFGLSDSFYLDPEDASDSFNIEKKDVLQKDGKRNIRLIEDIRAFAGTAIDLNSTNALDAMPQFSIPGMDGDLFAIEIQGDSMSPTITNGDLVVCELLETQDPIRNNQVYVIVTDTIVAKRVQPIKEDHEVLALKLISDNDDVYKPYDINVEDIRHILKVKTRLTNYGMS